MQFLTENRMSDVKFFGQFGHLKTESEQNFCFPHIPSLQHIRVKQWLLAATM